MQRRMSESGVANAIRYASTPAPQRTAAETAQKRRKGKVAFLDLAAVIVLAASRTQLRSATLRCQNRSDIATSPYVWAANQTRRFTKQT